MGGSEVGREGGGGKEKCGKGRDYVDGFLQGTHNVGLDGGFSHFCGI